MTHKHTFTPSIHVDADAPRQESRTEPETHESVERATARLIQLQHLSAALAGAANTMQVANAILDYGFTELGANAGSVALLSEDGKEFITVQCVGYPPEVEAKYKRYPFDTRLPNADAARAGEALFVETLEERNRLYPHLARTTTQQRRGALLALPLTVKGRLLGGIGFSFPTDRTFDAYTRTFALTVAELCALAIARTRSVEAEIALRQAIENSMLAGIAATDLQGRQTYAGPAFCRMVQWSEEELLGHTPPYPYWPPEDTSAIMEAYQATLAGNCPPEGFELRLRRKNEERFHALVLPSPLRDSQGAMQGWMVSVTDISDRVRMEQNLRESEIRYRTLFENSRDAICVTAQGLLQYVNPAYAHMFGYGAPGELVGRSLLDLVAPGSRAEMEERITKRTRGETAPDFYEFQGLRKDEIEIDVEVHVSTYEVGGIVHSQAILRDITARKKRETAQRFMADASALLVSSLDIDRTLENIARLAVPHLADWCVIHLADQEGILHQVAASHIDPSKAALARKAGERYPPDADSPGGIYEVLRSGKTEYLNGIPEEMIRAVAKDEEHERILLNIGIRSYLCVALEARDRRLGTLTFIGAESGHRYGPEDVSLAEELARRAALAVDNARLFRDAQQEIERRERVEADQRESEKRFRLLIEQSPLSIQILAPNGYTLRVNRAWENLWGLTLEDLRDYNMLQDRQLVEKGIMPYIRKAFAGEAVAIPPIPYNPDETLPNSTRYADPERWTRAFMYPVKDEVGVVREVVLIHEDITKRVHAERALRESEDRYRRIVETAQEGIWIIDAEYKTTFVNNKMAQMLGYTVEEMRGRPLLNFMDAEMQALTQEKMERRRQGIREQYDARYRRKDGSDLWVIINATPMLDNEGRFTGAMAMMLDITARKQAEKSLRESEAWYRHLADAMPQMVWTTRPDGVPDYFNQRWYDYTGCTLETTIALGWDNLLPKEDQQRAREAWMRAVQTGEPFEVEYRLRSHNGIFRWVLARGVPFKDEHGQVVKWFGTCTDIEQQKRTEETQRFLRELGELMRPHSNPIDVLWKAVKTIGAYLRVEHCAYAEVDEANNLMTGYRDYTPTGEQFAGTYPLDSFGAYPISELKTGRTLVVEDAATDPRLADVYADLYCPSNIRAFICVPLLKDGRLVAVLSVTMYREPRLWTPEEIGLLEKVMEQTWLAVENARLYYAERQRSEQLARAIAEVHHRVKNNLQSVSALLEMQIVPGIATIPVEAVRDSLSQVKTIALVHDLLTGDRPIGTVDASQVLANLGRLLSSSMSLEQYQTRIVVDAEPVEMSTRTATALALAVNELLTNAAKHHVGKEEGNTHRDAINVSMRRDRDAVSVVVQDAGPGFHADFDPLLHANIGLQLVQTLVEHDLHGRVRFGNATSDDDPALVRGGRVEIAFPAATCAEE